MIATCEDELICDFAEYYHINSIEAFPADYISILANGLRENSRVKLKLSGLEVDINTLLLARICDSSALNVYSKTKDAKHNKNKPPSILNAILHKEKKVELRTFASGAYFIKEWRRLNGN